MSQTIAHFMWGFQHIFRVNQEVHAKAVFRLLDDRFDPEVFLVGLRVEERANRYPACVEPEDEWWVASEAFDGVVDAAKNLPDTYPESRIIHSHRLVQEGETERLKRRAIHEILAKTIAECPTTPKGMCYFASFPVSRDGYLVSTILGLQEDVINAHARLSISRAQIHEYRSFEAAVSLIDATIHEFLKDAASELGRPDAGESLGSLRSPAELVRIAGARFMMDCAYKADRDSDQIGYWQGLFDACNSLAALRYEQAVGRGRLILARAQHPALKPAIEFCEPVNLHNSRATRKLLELASRGLALHINAKSIFGLVDIGQYATQQEDLFEINVLDHYRWELAHAGHTLMHVHSGQPRLPALPFDAVKLRADLIRVFPGISLSNADHLVDCVSKAVTEKHGTMLVVVEDAAEEAQRLASQATVIQPSPTTPELIKHVTPIDGAVLLGPDGVCHAIGVILDGMASPHGNPARGARFNSAIRYVEAHEKACMAIVVSEDGGVDQIPDLMPTIRRSDIEQVIRELESILSEPSIRLRRFNNLVDWLEGHSFYLLPGHCESINALIHRIDERAASENPSNFRIIRRDFVPHSGFDPLVYYTPE